MYFDIPTSHTNINWVKTAVKRSTSMQMEVLGRLCKFIEFIKSFLPFFSPLSPMPNKFYRLNCVVLLCFQRIKRKMKQKEIDGGEERSEKKFYRSKIIFFKCNENKVCNQLFSLLFLFLFLYLPQCLALFCQDWGLQELLYFERIKLIVKIYRLWL